MLTKHRYPESTPCMPKIASATKNILIASAEFERIATVVLGKLVLVNLRSQKQSGFRWFIRIPLDIGSGITLRLRRRRSVSASRRTQAGCWAINPPTSGSCNLGRILSNRVSRSAKPAKCRRQGRKHQQCLPHPRSYICHTRHRHVVHLGRS